MTQQGTHHTWLILDAPSTSQRFIAGQSLIDIDENSDRTVPQILEVAQKKRKEAYL